MQKYHNPYRPRKAPREPLLTEALGEDKRLWRLYYLWDTYQGLCQRCGWQTYPMFLAVATPGWEVHQRSGVILSPAGELYKIATIQHIVPRSFGGTNTWSNLTLYCAGCNELDNLEFLLAHRPRSKRKSFRRSSGTALQRWADDGGQHLE